MYSPDLIQRVYFEKKNGDEHNFNRVFEDLRRLDFTFISSFDFNGRIIRWTYFESKLYDHIIMEADNYMYFYLWDESLAFEVIIPGHINDGKMKAITQNTHYLHYVWVIGSGFPGLENFAERPVKINLQRIKNRSFNPNAINNLNRRFKQILLQYESLSQPIFEPIDYQKHGDRGKPWRKIVDKKR